MALIKCPECGKEVSDKASQCIHCGYPISSINNQSQFKNVKIKIGTFMAGTTRVFEKQSNRKLWEGKAGTVASFDVEGPVSVFVTWGLSKKGSPESTRIVEPGKSYELTMVNAGLFGLPRVVFNEIDHIDSSDNF